MSVTPLFLSPVSAGFPSPASDYIEQSLNLHDYVVKRPASTFFVRAQGESMTGVGIMNGDILVVDRAIQPAHGAIVIAAIDGELTCKCLDKYKSRLLAANTNYAPILLGTESELLIEGVVTHSITTHHVRTG